MTGPTTRRLALASVLLAGSLLTGCSSDDEQPGSEESSAPSESPTPTGTASATPYLPVPEDVELTAQGSELELGESAVVAWQPRQESVGAIEVTVTRVERTTFARSFEGWKLDARTRKSTPYFVRTKVTNVGDTDLGGRRVPLYLVTEDNTLIDYSSFKGTFKPCPSKDFPKKFAPEATVTTCQVHLVPRGAEPAGVAFRPAEDFAPVIWSGDVRDLGDRKGTKKQGGQKSGDQGRQGSGNQD